MALDLLVVAAVAGVVLAAALAGRALKRAGVDIFLPFPPLLAEWLPHLGPGTVFAVLIAVGVVAWGPALVERMRWRNLLALGWATSFAWTLALALSDGYSKGFATRLTSRDEYLTDVARVTDIPAMLRDFTAHILTDQPGAWTTHVGAHPPGAFLLFVWLDRIGLGGGPAASAFCVVVGSSACVAVAVAVRALAGEDLARTVLPFSVLFPGAVWVGVSADGVFAAVLAWGVAGIAVASTRGGRMSALAATGAGVLLGFCLYLSYGLALGAVLVLAVIAVTRSWRAVLFAVLGVAAVVAAFTVAGFWWITGYELTKVLYAGSIAQSRPYSYFIWANLAALVLALGPAVIAGLRRVAGSPRRWGYAPVALVVAALTAVLVADISGLSKAEVERIWLPFGTWLVVACAWLPRAHWRGWLAAQAVLALLVNHLLLTVW
ncbi:hypothetical protein [Actinokineospora globicatena]|uniref:Integral membrane protein n=1 Tax=Actinokineospora globicatena TaxID=103729 RepID=A0A9W6QJF0_9PSEU|nr:hypothetical protein [Actinokineospora globicatena]GLW89692.1 hypothetical protein Aglo03_05080 [Actinokineospora globicatena]